MGESRAVAPLHGRSSQYGLPSMGMLKRGVEVRERREVRTAGREEGGQKRRSSPALSDIS